MEPIPWKQFFDEHAPHYDKNTFTRSTKVEVQFLRDVMKLEPGMKILDIGCGTGRHSVELALMGLKVTGIDISPGMLSVARAKAADAGADVEFIEADAVSWSRIGGFDAGICLCEGAFNLVNPDEDPIRHDLGILSSAAASLKSCAPFVLTALNGYATIRQMTDEMVEQGSFNPATMDLYRIDEMNLPEGVRALAFRERLFIAPELVALLHHAGFEVKNVWGGTAGEWGERPLKLDEIEAMFNCVRK